MSTREKRFPRGLRPQHLVCTVLLGPIVALLAACGAAGAASGAGAGTISIPERVTDKSYSEAARTYFSLALDDPGRTVMRDRILAYLSGVTSALVEANDYDAVVTRFAAMTDLYSPDDFVEGRLSRTLETPARYLRDRGSRRGDEPKVLSALLVLRLLHPDQRELAREYQQLVQWGRQSRSTLPSAIERLSRLIDVWEEHARLTPSRDALSYLARLHIERRDAVVRMLGPEGQSQVGVSFEDLRAAPRLLQVAPLEVTGIFLRHGDVASAITSVASMGNASGVEGRLLRLLRVAQEDGSDGADALIELGDAYREARPEVALGVCRLGQRRFHSDARFPVCLARIAAVQERYADATAWYARAIELAPGERAVYDEALETLDQLIAGDLLDPDVNDARTLAENAETVLAERMRRWPGSTPPVAPERLQLLIGVLEMNAGNADAARARFERSISLRENAPALLQLGLLLERTGRFGEAARLYQRALALTPRDSPESRSKQAELLERLGDAQRQSGNDPQSRRYYEQSLNLWDQAVANLDGPGLALVHVRRGVLFDRLGRHPEAAAAFRQAMAAAPGWREVYATTLSHLVVNAPDLPLAYEVFRRAQRQLALEPEWKVYFALWMKTIAGRGGQAPEEDVLATMRELSTGEPWWSRLAKFGIDELSYEELLQEASSRGERSEAHFYGGARLLVSGDNAGALRLFRLVLDMNMVSFYEFAMAQQLASTIAPTSAQPRRAEAN